jgi:hypothetical protein
MKAPKRIRTSHVLAALALLSACGGGNSPVDAGADLAVAPDLASTPADLATNVDSAVAPPDLSQPATPATLTLSLDPTLDLDHGDVKATSFTSATLLDRAGNLVAMAMLPAAGAVFLIGNLGAGDYFIDVNGNADSLVPTRIDDPTRSFVQRVGTKLCHSMIGPTGAPMYRAMTYAAGQGWSPAMRFSDGTPVPGEQPYVLVTYQPPKIEFKVLGTGQSLSTYVPTESYHNEEPFASDSVVPFDAWLLNTNGLLHHGDAYNTAGAPAICATCHATMDTKPTTYSGVTVTNGWCYRCHGGTTGSDSGFFDPMK